MRLLKIAAAALLLADAMSAQNSDAGKSEDGHGGKEQTKAPSQPVPKGSRENQPGREGGKETRVVFPLPAGLDPSFDVIPKTSLSVKAMTAEGEIERPVHLHKFTVPSGTKVSLTAVEVLNGSGAMKTAVKAEQFRDSRGAEPLTFSVEDRGKAEKILKQLDSKIGAGDLKDLDVIYLACEGEHLLTLDQVATQNADRIKFCPHYAITPDAKKLIFAPQANAPSQIATKPSTPSTSVSSK